MGSCSSGSISSSSSIVVVVVVVEEEEFFEARFFYKKPGDCSTQHLVTGRNISKADIKRHSSIPGKEFLLEI